MLSCEGVGKTIERAIENALLELKAPREDVDIKILEEGGLFKKAKVLVSISEDVREKYEKKLAKKEQVKEEPVVKSVIAADSEISEKVQPVATAKVEYKKEETKAVETQKLTEETKPETVKPEPKGKENKADNEECVVEKGKEFILGIMQKLSVNGEVEVIETDESVTYKISGEKCGNLVGYRGECLNALQFLVSVVSQKNRNEYKKVVLDIDNYREKREQTLIALAHRMARKVAKTNHQVKLEPMSANERRIIHTALQSDTFVTTVSKGTEPNRYLVILPKKDKQ